MSPRVVLIVTFEASSSCIAQYGVDVGNSTVLVKEAVTPPVRPGSPSSLEAVAGSFTPLPHSMTVFGVPDGQPTKVVTLGSAVIVKSMVRGDAAAGMAAALHARPAPSKPARPARTRKDETKNKAMHLG